MVASLPLRAAPPPSWRNRRKCTPRSRARTNFRAMFIAYCLLLLFLFLRTAHSSCSCSAKRFMHIMSDLKLPPQKKNENMACTNSGKMRTKSTSRSPGSSATPFFRRSTLLDEVDCFDTLKSQTYQWHEFTTLLFQGHRDLFKVVMKHASGQNRFLCDVIERKRTSIHLAAITMRLGTVFCGPSRRLRLKAAGNSSFCSAPAPFLSLDHRMNATSINKPIDLTRTPCAWICVAGS